MKFLHLLVFTLLICVSFGGCAQKVCTIRKPPKGAYCIKGKTYYPLKKVDRGYRQNGVASWYGPKFNGRKTACGEIYNMHGLTAASPVLPMNTLVRVVNLENRQDVIVRINDRGPFVDDRVIDLSLEAAKRIAMVGPGTAPVSIEVLGDSGTALAKKKPRKSAPPPTLAAPNPYYKAFADRWIAVSKPAKTVAAEESPKSPASPLRRISDWFFS